MAVDNPISPSGSAQPSNPNTIGEAPVVSAAKSVTKPWARSWFPLFVRIVLAGYFLRMGMHKVLNPSEFLALIRQYDLTNSHFILNSIAAALPWFEVFCGLLLLTGVAVRGSALVVLAMLLPFSIVVLKRALVMASAQGLAFCAVQFDCGCGSGEIIICHKLIENCGLMLVALWLIFCPPQKLSLRYSLFKS